MGVSTRESLERPLGELDESHARVARSLGDEGEREGVDFAVAVETFLTERLLGVRGAIYRLGSTSIPDRSRRFLHLQG